MSERPNAAELIAQAENAISCITDPDLRRIAFEKVLNDSRGLKSASLIDSASKLLQVLSVVVGVVITVLSFNAARQTEAHAREAEAAKRQAEATRPFLELRQKSYLEAVQVAAVLANPEDHTEDELKEARTRFRALYVAELSLVEGVGVEDGMIALARTVDPELRTLTEKQLAAYELAHALRDSLAKSWKLTDDVVDNPHR